MDISSQIQSSLLAAYFPPPSPALLENLTAKVPCPPLPSLLATAKARLLAGDLTSSPHVNAAALASFPADITNVTKKETRLAHNVHVQVLDVENISASRWDQILELEAVAKGERTRGREVIRVVEDRQADEEDPGGGGRRQPVESNAGGGNAVHRLVLQDGRGVKVYAVELSRVNGVGVGKTCIGEKMMLKARTLVARGSVLLEPDNIVLLGGKVETWHKSWVDGQLARLKAAVGAEP